jgi:hypothetical protein
MSSSKQVAAADECGVFVRKRKNRKKEGNMS